MVAIKQFRDIDIQTQKLAQREISVLKLMNGHPNIIQLFQSFKYNEKVFLVFELMQQTLLEHIQKQPDQRLNREEVRFLVFQMVSALDYIHSKNAVHRDIKPENMLIQKVFNENENSSNKISKKRGSSQDIRKIMEDNQEDGVYILKICDFGQSKEMQDTDGKLTEYISTRWYRAPELLVGSKFYDKSIDIWALGCIIPELINGKPLFPGNSNLEALAFILKTLGNNLTQDQKEAFNLNRQFEKYGKIPNVKKIVPLEERVPELSPIEVSFIKSCLQFDPDQRATAKELLNHQYLISYKDQQYIHKQDQDKCPEEQKLVIESPIISEESENVKKISELDSNLIKQSSNQSESHESQELVIELVKEAQIVQERKESSYSKYKKKKRSNSSNQNTNNNNISISSGAHNSNNHHKEFVVEHHTQVEQSRHSNTESSHSNLNSRQNQKRDEQNPREETQIEEQTANQKQLPKPILFLRKQKEARQSLEKNLFKDKLNKLGTPEENPFQAAADIANQSAQHQPSNVGRANNRVSEPIETRSPITPFQKSNLIIEGQQSVLKGGSPNFFKKSNPKAQKIENPSKELTFTHKNLSNQPIQIPKNQIQFITKKNSPPLKINNQKIVMVNKIQTNNQLQQNQFKATFSKQQKRPSIQQDQQRNISVPNQVESTALLKEDLYQIKKLSNKMFQPYGQDYSLSYSPNSFQTGKKDNLPKLIKERRLEEKLKIGSDLPLLNTQKHVSNKLQLPQISYKNSQMVQAQKANLHYQKQNLILKAQKERELSQNSQRQESNHQYGQTYQGKIFMQSSQNQERNHSSAYSHSKQSHIYR